ILTLTAGEFLISENGEPRRVIDVSCPEPRAPRPISAVLALDVSGSMHGPGLKLAQAAAGAWINALPSGLSECAIVSFNHGNALRQDFTNDKALLQTAVDGLYAGGGTSFDAAFITPFAGALHVVKRAAQQPVIVLLTDGHATGNQEEIIRMANTAGARIYCITLDNEMPDILREIAIRTGGRYFENVSSTEDARRIYRAILDIAQDLPPCIVTWESAGCAYYRFVDVQVPAYGLSASSSWQMERNELPHLVALPGSVVDFGLQPPGTTAEKQVTIRAEGATVHIEEISVEPPAFVISDYGGTAPPFDLESGQERTLTLSYTAVDSAYIISRVRFLSNACEAELFATAGTPGSGGDRRVITVLHPNGGEMFVAGSDTVITWKGVAPTDPVRLEYSTDHGATWRLITGQVTGLSYSWRVPNTPSDYCLVRVTAEEPTAVPDDMVLIPAGSFVMGDNSGVGTQDERPTSRVTLTRSFLMTMTEITRRQWLDMGMSPDGVAGGPDDSPVHRVEMREVLEYCNRRSLAEGLQPCYTFPGSSVHCDFEADGYRIPTEAEWEYACRAGSNEHFHSGSMQEPMCDPEDANLGPVGWYCGNAQDVMPVARKQPNAFGLHDMHGNVRELCWGNAAGSHTPEAKMDPRHPNPMDMTNLIHRPVARGGWYGGFASECRSAARYNAQWGVRTRANGFRVVRNL
ncbi:MAG: SUMF1/EgtB/PvdO family nonheme iron enzyme, partial [Bacteroidetes bacterium]|nr:SUMF1/EgtB/PvdO family nonheme iron enzyme [Bacteroidota bacterium]